MMKNLLRLTAFICMMGFSTLYAFPSPSALDASLASIGSPEAYDEIAPLSDITENYKTGYIALYKRYQETREEHAKIEQKFKDAGIPLYFSLIPYCESKFNPSSHGYGTAGLWQFAKQSGRTYGLCIKKGTDERLDTERSTEAAIRYIKELKQIFGSWYLADFAYGMGEMKLKQLIKNNGSKKISVLLKDPHFPKGTKAHFAKTLLLDAKIHYSPEPADK